MEEHPFNREEVHELLKDRPTIRLRSLGGEDYKVRPLTPNGLTRKQRRTREALAAADGGQP